MDRKSNTEANIWIGIVLFFISLMAIHFLWILYTNFFYPEKHDAYFTRTEIYKFRKKIEILKEAYPHCDFPIEILMQEKTIYKDKFGNVHNVDE